VGAGGALVPPRLARRARGTFGVAVAAFLEELRGVASAAGLRDHYRARDIALARANAEQCGLDREDGLAVRRSEDSAYGLRWLELAHGLPIQLDRSLIPQLPPGLLI
jgi:hypothetical protein